MLICSQRAERSEAVRRHVRSRITQQNHENQRNPEITSDPCLTPSALTLNAISGSASGVPQCQGPTGGPEDSENSRRSQVIRFLLPSDAACPQTPDSSHDAARGHRPSPALRLRSRSSRLRWEKRSAEAGRSTDNSEEGQEQSERVETAGGEGSEETVKTEGTEVVNESEELFSGTESESPSLLLTHWNTCGQTETGDMAINPGGRGQKDDIARNGRQKGTEEAEESENSGGQRDGSLCEDGSNKDTEQNAAELIESENSPDNTVEITEEKSEINTGEHDVKGVGLLDSCTLVEGLLFPVEYYVRTTRRMTSSQSQPDMQAVILSQLSTGRPRRSRGRGRGRGRGRALNRHMDNHGRSEKRTEAGFSSLTTASASVGPRMESQTADTSADLNCQISSEFSDQISACQIDTGACFSPTVIAARPARGRKRRRGRGRGRPQTSRSVGLDTHELGLGRTSDDPQPTSSPVSSSTSLQGADGPKPCLTPVEVVPVPDDPQPAPTHSTAPQPSSGANGAQSNSASGHQVYPIFLKSSSRTNGATQISAARWQSLLLPSTPPAQTSLLPLPSLPPGPLVNNLMNFDIPQDFHLPDDQFASLKLHKLRQVTVESGVEHFTSPSYNTRRSMRRSGTCYSGSDPVMPLPLPLSLTPTIASSPHPAEAKQAATQSVELHDLSKEHKLTGKLTSQSSTEVSSDQENPGEQQTDNLHPECQTHATSTESVSVVQDCAADCADQRKEKDNVILNTYSQSCVSDSNTHRSIDRSVKPLPHIKFADRPAGKVNDYVINHSDELEMQEISLISSEDQTDCAGVVHPLEDQRSANHQTEDKAIIKTLSFDCPEEPVGNCTAVQACDNSEAPESPVQHLNVKSPAKESKESSEPTTSPSRENKSQDKCLPHHSVHSQLLLSPPPASAPCPFTTPHLRSSAITSSPTLPSLGTTPHPVSAALPLTSSPSAPDLILPPPHSPSTQALSPPALSPCPSLALLPPSQPSTPQAGQIQASHELPQRVEPATCPTVSSIRSQGSGVQVGLRTEETVEEHVMRCTHTLKAPAGGCLVDACCLPGSTGGLWVAAAGKWAVCLWSQTSASDWKLIHTWAFNEPVISVFPVPDAAGLMCVTLGQLEIREVRMLSCASLLQVLLCEGVVQAVVAVSKSRVVTSSHSASGSTLQVFALSDSGSTLSSQPLMSPGVCVGALAPVDGLPDALIGTDEGGRLFIWNLKTGQLLRKIVLRDDLSHTACLRGYSYCGVLFVLLQHQLLSSLEEEEREATAKDQMFVEEEEEEERKKTALLSLVAVNPLSGKSVKATQLYPPKAWSGRLCEADVNSSSVVGLSQSGCVCVWELGRQGASRMVWAPESEGWQLARWGGGGTLVTGHHNGDVTLHCYSTSQTPLHH
ncbi:uncharacterized protein palb2 isoform X2 [Dicentrarchus labrax]|uniref:uncharacterized protein palb2 isoform X2 n=1 Tax=Dicentrarchus labrax TaxID=13489 RepID=UPI0021F5FC15|nr:uncharacterized protein palb2 isoform X2 [Dicentrarchus labrax]